jgi:predicted nucleic acid-binding protein
MNSDRLVVNASPIISLARIGCADLLLGLSSELVVPKGVWEEIMAHRSVDPAMRWLSDKAALVQAVEVPPMIAEWNLGKGESQVIACALQRREFMVAIDDKAAKRCAESFDIRVRGTVALIVEAKRRQLVPEAGSLLLKLKSNGFRMAEPVFSAALRLAGE